MGDSGMVEWPGYDDIVAAVTAGNVTLALELLSHELAGELPPDRAYTMCLLRGRLLTAIGEVAEAFPAFADALSSAGSAREEAAALLARAEAAETIGDVELARADATSALPNLADSLDQLSAQQLLARIERDFGDLAKAISLLEEIRFQADLLDVPPDRMTEITLDLAMALRLGGQTRRSIELLESLVEDAEPALAARFLIQIGTTYGFERDFDAALDAYARALPLLENSVDRATVRYNRAVVLRDSGDRVAARDEIGRALVENAGQDARVELDALMLAGIIAHEQDDLPAAIEFLREATELAPDDERHGQVRLSIGTALAGTGLFGPAIEEFSAAIVLCEHPDDLARAYQYRGRARLELGLFDAALGDFRDAIAQTSDLDEQARGELTIADVLLKRNERDEARDTLDRAVSLATEPETVREVLMQRGAARASMGDLDGALVDLERAADMAVRAGEIEQHSEILLDLGTIRTAMSDGSSARQILQDVAAEAVSGPVAYRALMQLAQLSVVDNEPLSALQMFERAATAAEDDRDARAAAFLARATAGLRWGRYGDAREDLTRMMTLQPSVALAEQAMLLMNTVRQQIEHLDTLRGEFTSMIAAADAPSYRARPTMERGLMALEAGDYTAAMADLTRATSLFRPLAEKAVAHAQLARAHAWLGECVDALAHLADAVTFDPSRSWIPQVQGDPHWSACRDHSDFPADLL